MYFTMFCTNIPDTASHQIFSSSHVTQHLFLHYLGKTELMRYYIFIQGSIISLLK